MTEIAIIHEGPSAYTNASQETRTTSTVSLFDHEAYLHHLMAFVRMSFQFCSKLEEDTGPEKDLLAIQITRFGLEVSPAFHLLEIQ